MADQHDKTNASNSVIMDDGSLHRHEILKKYFHDSNHLCRHILRKDKGFAHNR